MVIIYKSRTTYEIEDRKIKQPTPPADTRIMTCPADIYDISTNLVLNRTPANANAVMEFMVDCYTAMWQNILRNGEYIYLLLRNIYYYFFLFSMYK